VFLPQVTGKSAKALQAKAHHADFFGNPKDEDSMGYAEQLCCGLGFFSAMFDTEEDLAKGAIKLVMKSTYQCLEPRISPRGSSRFVFQIADTIVETSRLGGFSMSLKLYNKNTARRQTKQVDAIESFY
jgi:hypothetical protein